MATAGKEGAYSRAFITLAAHVEYRYSLTTGIVTSTIIQGRAFTAPSSASNASRTPDRSMSSVMHN